MVSLFSADKQVTYKSVSQQWLGVNIAVHWFVKYML